MRRARFSNQLGMQRWRLILLKWVNAAAFIVEMLAQEAFRLWLRDREGCLMHGLYFAT